MARLLLVLFAVCSCSCSCSKASDESKLMQEPAPQKDVEPPPDLSIAVAVDGAGRPPITAQTLRTVKPDFADAERRAWLIPTLIADASATGTTVEASSATGMSLKLVHPTAEGLEPVLFLTRRGEVIVSAIDPKDPFPDYHGRGGRLHRAGDQLPHVGPVAKLSITHAP
jgi:hypothetical protein